MTKKTTHSRTMRIDLIPETPHKPRKSTRAPRDGGGSPPRAKANVSYADLYQRSYDAVLVTDGAGHIVDVNPRACVFFGYKEEEFLALDLSDVISGADPSLVNCLCDNLKNTQYALMQAYCPRKNGSFFPAEIAVGAIDADVKQLSFTIRDITFRKQAEEMLMTEHNAIQNLGNAVLIANLEGSLEFVNPAALQIWGHKSAEDMLGKNIRDLLVDKEAADTMIHAVLDEKQMWVADLQASTARGRQVDVQVVTSCNRNADGKTVGLILSVVDITDRRQAEHAQREAERRRVMLESLGAACYHLGQPATVLLANLGVIQKRLGSADDVVKEVVKTSIEAAESIGAILHRLNTVNEYKTTEYLEKAAADSGEGRILDI